MSNEKIIVVGSGTGLKPNCVQEVFKEYKVVNTKFVQSGVSEQPIGQEETRRGAINRATAALIEQPSAIFSFGIENGLIQNENKEWVDKACMICLYNQGEYNGKIIEKWTDYVSIPLDWVELALKNKNKNLTYVMLAQQTFDHLKNIDLKDPHSYLTKNKKSRKMFLIETLHLIKSEIL